jgi:hypothetical protein
LLLLSYSSVLLGLAIGCKPCLGWEFHTRTTLVAHLDSMF